MPKKILSIDDSHLVHMVVSKTFRALDVEVLTAVNGQEGLEKAQKERPDLIILDATLPVTDGLEALTALKMNPATKEIPVIMLSADTANDQLDRARHLGAVDFVPKPFTGDALLAVISPYISLDRKAA